jgi:hypothetical protein
MAVGGKTTNTSAEILKSILGDLAMAKAMPDANLEFLTGLETSILAELRRPMEMSAGGTPGSPVPPPMPGAPEGPMPPAPPAGGMGSPPGAPPGMPPDMGGMGLPPIPPSPQNVPGGPGSNPVIPPDELSRLLAGSA